MQCDPFVQESHPTEVRMELIDQLRALSSGNMPPDVATLLLSPEKGRWGEDSDPTTPLGGRTFSDLSDEVSPMCQTVNWDEPPASQMLSLPPGEPLFCTPITATGYSSNPAWYSKVSWIEYDIMGGRMALCVMTTLGIQLDTVIDDCWNWIEQLHH